MPQAKQKGWPTLLEAVIYSVNVNEAHLLYISDTDKEILLRGQRATLSRIALEKRKAPQPIGSEAFQVGV